MKITIFTPKHTQLSFIKSGIKEYTKRLSRYCQLKEVEYTSIAQLQQKISDKSITILVASKYETITSEALAQTIDQIGISGNSSINFCLLTAEGQKEMEQLGSSFLSSTADLLEITSETPSYLTTFALSKMNLSPEISLLLLYEQVYRSYRILNGEPYHK